MNPKDSILYLTNKLRRLRNSILFSNLATGLAILLTVAAGLIILGWLFNQVFWLSTDFRTAFVVFAGVWLAGVLITKIISRLIRRPSSEDVALLVERQYPDLKNHLIASLQLEKNLRDNREGFSTELIEAVIDRSRQMSDGIDFGRAVDRGGMGRWG
jgi:hypothetical protein